VRAQKAALDQLMRRIQMECTSVHVRELKKRLADLKLKHAPAIAQLQRLNEEVAAIEGQLEKAGLRIDCDGEPQLSHDATVAVDKQTRALRERFATMQSNIIVRFPIVDEAEKSFMLRHFYSEVAKEFPALQSLVGKAGDNGKVQP
jgi:hypothetical protein